MNYKLGLITTLAAPLLAISPAQAQDQTGQELIGRTVDVQFANGARNIVAFGSGGQARITAADGTLSNANWFVRGNQLCMQMGAMGECWGYNQRFEAGRALTMSSTCNETSQWIARSVNPAPVVAPPAAEQGERG